MNSLYGKKDPLVPGLLSPKKDPYQSVSSSMLDVFKKEASGYKGAAQVVRFLFDIPEIVYSLRMDFFVYELPFIADSPLDNDDVDAFKLRDYDWQRAVKDSGYIVDNTGYVNTRKGVEFISDALRRSFDKEKNLFQLIAEIKVFDGSRVRIYKRIDG